MFFFKQLPLREKDLNSALIELYSKAKKVEKPFDLAEAMLILLSSTCRNSFTSTNLRIQLVFINTYLHKHILGATRPGKLCLGYQRRYYSSNNSPKYLPLNPEWITGFTDAEGSFIISIFKDDNYKFKWRISAYFSIHIQVKDALLLGLIHKTLGVGKLLLFPKGKG